MPSHRGVALNVLEKLNLSDINMNAELNHFLDRLKLIQRWSEPHSVCTDTSLTPLTD